MMVSWGGLRWSEGEYVKQCLLAFKYVLTYKNSQIVL